jgi:hypothetical protein
MRTPPGDGDHHRISPHRPKRRRSKGLVRDDDTSVGQDILDIAKAQTEMMTKPSGMANDFGKESVTVVARTTDFLALNLAGTHLKFTTPLKGTLIEHQPRQIRRGTSEDSELEVERDYRRETGVREDVHGANGPK